MALTSKESMQEQIKIRKMKKMYDAGFDVKSIAETFNMTTIKLISEYGHYIISEEDAKKALDEEEW